MNKTLFFLLIACFQLCYSQNIHSILVKPNETDSLYSLNEKQHYITSNINSHQKKLVLFIGGSFSTPNNYNYICDFVANLGFDVISLSYFNEVAAGSLAIKSDEFVFDKYRQEICFGTPVSNEVEVDSLHAIETKTSKLLNYLKHKYPGQNWGNYIKDNKIIWENIIVSGHSQGSGHACYLAKMFAVHKVVMFAGPNDFNSNLNLSANWLGKVGKTNLNKHFALLHEKDEVISYTFQINNFRKLGVLQPNELPFLVEKKSKIKLLNQVFSVKIKGILLHSSVVGKNKLLPKIWTYMFTSN